MRRGAFLLLLVCPVLAGCVVEPRKQAVFPIKIGLLSDSQITSQNGFSNFHYRSKFADTLVEVGIRPPAIECFLAEEMLQIALNKLTQDPYGDKKGVDVILYLGDAANSGGADEIDTVLTIMARHREQTGVPIFIVIGNHDYLGAGNIVTPGIRFALLNRIGRPDNPPLTKYEVLKKYSEFNHGNNRLPANNRFQYMDNVEALEQNKNLDHDTGLYLCGILTYRELGKDNVDIFLLDSSDYKDAPDWSEAAKVGFYGAIGSVSFKDEPGFVSQTGYLKKYARASSPQFRFIASHYPKDHLDRITFAKPGQVPLNVTNLTWSVTESAFSIASFSKTLNQNLGLLVSPGGKNYWVSGHTHVPTIPRSERFIVGGLMGEKYFTSMNVGSTTDYRTHVAIVERYEQNKNNRLDNSVGYREIPLFEGGQALLASIPEAIGQYGLQHASDPNFRPLIPSMDEWLKERAKQSGDLRDIKSSLLGGPKSKAQVDCYWFDVGATILGLNKKYIEDAWQEQQTNASAVHLRNFTERFVSRTGSNREEVLAFLGLIAGAYENELLAYEFDISPGRFKKLCNNPE